MKIIIVMITMALTIFASDATIEVSKKVDRLPSIMVENASTFNGSKIDKHFFKVLVSDLNVLSLFNVSRKYQKVAYESGVSHFSNKASDYIVRYRVRKDDRGDFITDVKLFQNDTIVMKKSYKIHNSAYYVFLVHTIAYDINKFFGAEDIAWIKRKVIFSRLISPGKSEILVSDYTLNYKKVLVRGGMNIFPKWSSQRQDAFYFTSLNGVRPTLYKYNFTTGKKSKILTSDGMLICSDISPNGKKLLLTMAPNSQPDIYIYNVVTRKYKRVTRYSGIDVNGQFMDNDDIAFISNRLGYPNVFKKHLGSRAVEQLVYYGRSNSACSAYKNYVVYKARESDNAFSPNTFNLHLVSTKTDFIRRLTASGVNEFPRFSRDGKVILFIKSYKSQSSIGIIRLAENKNFLFPLKLGKIQSIDW